MIKISLSSSYTEFNITVDINAASSPGASIVPVGTQLARVWYEGNFVRIKLQNVRFTYNQDGGTGDVTDRVFHLRGWPDKFNSRSNSNFQFRTVANGEIWYAGSVKAEGSDNSLLMYRADGTKWEDGEEYILRGTFIMEYEV